MTRQTPCPPEMYSQRNQPRVAELEGHGSLAALLVKEGDPVSSSQLEKLPHILWPEQIRPPVAAQCPRELSPESPSNSAVQGDKMEFSFLKRNNKTHTCTEQHLKAKEI